MSELDNTINAVDEDVTQREASDTNSRRKSGDGLGVMLPKVVFAGLAILVIYQLNTLTSSIFGVPEESVQADIVSLLEATDARLQIEEDEGAYPDRLPPDMPRWMLGYKKTLAGYQISAEVDGVTVELNREGDSVSIDRVDP